MDMALPPPLTAGWSEGHWPEGMYTVLGMDCNSSLSPFGSNFLSCDCFLTLYTLRECSLESRIGHVPPTSGTPHNEPQTGGGAVSLARTCCHRCTAR